MGDFWKELDRSDSIEFTYDDFKFVNIFVRGQVITCHFSAWKYSLCLKFECISRLRWVDETNGHLLHLYDSRPDEEGTSSFGLRFLKSSACQFFVETVRNMSPCFNVKCNSRLLLAFDMKGHLVHLWRTTLGLCIRFMCVFKSPHCFVLCGQ